MPAFRLICLTLLVAAAAAAQPSFDSILQNLKFREIGPANMGGRVDDFAVVESNPSIMYTGFASAGVWKTVNGGVTWIPVFDNQAVHSIGDITLAPSDPSIVWVGTGEPNNRQSSSWGNGVYRSMDAGKTWIHLGLSDTHHIGRIAVHPADPNTAYVAALGRLWGPNKERGVYKTTDGGKTWSQALFLNEDTGVVDIAMDHHSPNTLYAAAYQRRRTAYGYSGGGPHGGLYKTTDGGVTWTKLTKGLPEGGPVGRIGIAIYRRNPNILYLTYEHARGGTFRSDDKGETWTRMSDTNPRPSYYSQIHIDPNNDQRIWVLAAPMSYSDDGGRTFRTNLVARIHGDYHAMWINPANSDHVVLGSDGGIHFSWDRGHTWDYVNTLALGQFYEVGVDMRRPYNICGGLQDNGSWCGPSAVLDSQGITNADWFRVGGGDGFYVQIDPTDPDIVYAESQDGNLFRRNLKTGESRSVRPEPKEGEARYRFQWNSPVVISNHDSKVIYYGGNFLFRSSDRGDSWTRLGPDLTTGVDRNQLPILGVIPDRETLSRHDGVQAYPTITTVSESPLKPGILWVGTDDGNVQFTRDGGKTWKSLASKASGVAKGAYVSRVVASRFGEGDGYVAFDGHRSNDFGVHIFRVTEYGETWQRITNGIPPSAGAVSVIREHHRSANLLFAGLEFGAYASFDRGAGWHKIKANLPNVPVDDIAIHPRDNDLILGTHGRSIWVLDDLTPLEKLDAKALQSDLLLFEPRPATTWRLSGRGGATGHKIFLAENPPYGALLHYYLKSKPDEKERVRITILDKAGKTVREMDGAREAGLNRVAWNLRYASPVELTEQQRQAAAGGGGGGGGGGFFGGARGPMVEPGEYTVKIAAGKNEATKTVVVEEDPRITISAADRAARHKALMDLFEMYRTADRGQRSVTRLRTQLTGALEGWRRPGASKVPENVQKAAEGLSKQVDEVSERFVTPPSAQGSAGPPLVYRPPILTQRVGRLMSAIDGYTAAPTPQQMEDLQVVSKLLTETMDRVKKLTDEGLPGLNKLMNEAGVPHISLVESGTPPPFRRRR